METPVETFGFGLRSKRWGFTRRLVPGGRGGFQRLRLMPPTYSESIWETVWEIILRPPANRMAPKTWIFRGFGDPVLVTF